ncbi:putative C-type lectin BfL-2-like [Apostichopus japonicus]|uniref:Putative C-type lectin BfL-2-like n=1 Tax=Stichopus japonicus TaxID=307972 RepID=A0A2G8LID2_STIJA|nr:putative C-type lectin BfL-2-like [Apostichopus japonicus]
MVCVKYFLFLVVSLFIVLASGVCPKDSLSYNGDCYLFISENTKFFEAEAFCNNKSDELSSSHLVSIKDRDELEFVSAASLQLFGATKVWIGLNDENIEGQFEWTDGSIFNYSHFADGEPNNHSHREHCVHIYAETTWNDASCNGKKPFVCKRAQWEWAHECAP